MDLTDHLTSNGISNNEGCIHDCPEKVACIEGTILAEQRNFTVLEIGFHHGHSSEVFLKHKNDCQSVISFDLGEWWGNGKVGKKYLDVKYPGKHTIVIGDSTETVLGHIDGARKYDIIFIDGGHSFEVASADLKNCSKLAHKDTIVIVDDVIHNEEFHMHFTHGPSKAWELAKESGLVSELGYEDYRHGLGIAWGKYNL